MSKTETDSYIDDEEDDIPTQTQTAEDFTQNIEQEDEEEEINDDDLKEIFGSDSDENETEETLFGDAKRIKIPKLIAPKKDDKLILFKLPATLSIQKKAFSKMNVSQEEGMTRTVIRWRDYNGVRISNARIIEWDDGSMQLKVGETYFDISEQSMTKNHLFYSSDQSLIQQGVLNDKWVLKPSSLKDAQLSSFKIKPTEKRKTKTTTEQTPVSRFDEKQVRRDSARLQAKQNKALESSDYQYSDMKFKRKRRTEEEEYEAEKRISNSKKSVPQVKRKKRKTSVEDQELNEDFLEDDSEEEEEVEEEEEEEEEEDYNSEEEEEEDDYFEDE